MCLKLCSSRTLDASAETRVGFSSRLSEQGTSLLDTASLTIA